MQADKLSKETPRHKIPIWPKPLIFAIPLTFGIIGLSITCGPNVNPDDSISDANPSQHLRGEELQSISLKSRILESGLYVVATPIGNLGDITVRALEVLHSADHILAEDTRQTRKLLDAYDIKTPISAYHDHNAAKRVPKLIEDLENGQRYALVSDAGTPLISDPGFKLVLSLIHI